MKFFSNQLSSPKPIEEIVGEIHELVRSAENIKDHLPELVGQLKIYFNCEAITIFAVDQSNRQLYSTCYISDEVPEMRVDISLNNLAGYVAGTGNSLNIANVKDKAELAQYHPHLDHGSKWDNLLDFSSKSMIVVPIPFKQNLIGILEVINKKNNEAFSAQDLKYVQDIAPALGLVLVRYYNDGLQNKQSKQEAPADANDPDTADHDESLENQCTQDEVAEDADQVVASSENQYAQDEVVEDADKIDASLENQYTQNEDYEALDPHDSALEEDDLHDTDKEDDIRKISQAILEGKNLKEILTELKDSILDNFEAEGMTLYGLDSARNEIYSTFQSTELALEIRLPLAHSNIPGYVAMAKRPVNIVNVDNLGELKAYHSELSFDNFDNDPSVNKTSELLALPVMHEEILLGVLKIVNKRNKLPFTEKDEARAHIMAENLAHALSKQEQTPKVKSAKFSYLIENNLITEKILDSSIAYAKSNNVDIETVLMDRVGLKRENIGLSLENFYNLPYYGYEKSIILPAKILGGLNKNFLAKNFWIPIHSDNSKVIILTNDPTNLDRIQNIKHIFPKKEVEFKVGLKIDLMDFLSSILEQDGSFIEPVKSEQMSSLINTLQEENDDTQLLTESDEDHGGASEIKETDNAIIRLVSKVLTDAYDRGATDIHIEPGIAKDNITIRFRKDGDCSIYEEIPFLYKHAIISRIKIMAQLDIAERRIPQDGKIKLRYGKTTIEYRVATCPTVGENEDIVLRILAKSENLPLEKMNFSEKNFQLIVKNVTTPYGLILVVGPTGSGKTTTLHSCLGHINTPKRKIWTVEDPVEITQKGIRQVQTIEKKGLDFPRAMRSFLRGDPDVIMVGEMRDKETASIGLEASLTGHLVFSTLHTNSAPETITRLLDMGMNPLNFADSILLVVAQRLVKTLCKKCREDYHPTQEEFDTLVREYGEESFEKLGIAYNGDLTLKKPVGCDFCDNTGYAGRTGIHEVLEGTKALKRQIVKQASAEELRTTAIEEGMCTLKQDGIQKVFKGDCDLKQVLSVCII